jgi:protein-tyrosine phosphatase
MAEAIGEGLVQSIAPGQIEIRSAGTHTRDGLPASEGALRAADRNGLSLARHASAELTSELVEWADLIFAMGPGHLAQVEALGGGGKAFLLGEYAVQGSGDVGGPRGQDFAVPDPFGGGDEVYERTFQTLKNYVRSAMKRLVEEWGG